MKRSRPLSGDPGKAREWQERSARKAQERREEAARQDPKPRSGLRATKAPVNDTVPQRRARKVRPRPTSEQEQEGRRLVASRDAGICVMCGKPTAVLNWHHRKLRSQGGDWSASNGISLCGSGTTGCHGRAHANPGEAYASGWMVPGGREPAEYPVRSGGRWLLLADDGTATVIGHSEAQRRIGQGGGCGD